MSPKTRGYLFAFLAICIFAGQDAITKYLGDRYPALFITMIRFWAFALFVFAFAASSPGAFADRFKRGIPGCRSFVAFCWSQRSSSSSFPTFTPGSP